jgi:uncharacterized protein YyaL (SSP411 family)
LMVLANLEAYQASGAAKFKLTAKETLDYVLRDLASIEGGFYSAEDADSEGEEGKFYLWTKEEIEKALPEQDADLAVKLFEVKSAGNYNEAPGSRNSKNILHVALPLEQLASESNLTIDELIEKLGKIRNTLFQIREKRVHPAKDDKILVDWNGLTIAALARASQVLDEPKYLHAATKAADFILKQMKTQNNGLYHRYVKGESAVFGFLDDYAYLVLGLIELYEASFEEKYLQLSIELTKAMIEQFWDNKNSGFFLTDKNADEEVPRLKQTYDGAMPSGNSVALNNLLLLARLSGELTFEDYSSRLLRAFSEEVKGQPLGHTFMLVGLEFALGPSYNVVLVGDLADKNTCNMLAALRKKYLPNLTISLWTPKQAKVSVSGLVYEQIDAKTTAYVCRDQTCLPPTNSVDKMLKMLKS